MTIDLTSEQKTVTHAVIDRVKKGQEQVTTMSGYAGTGKTTCVKYLKERLSRFAVCAYTGKAADVLRRKGVDAASTIHSLIYQPVVDANGNVQFEFKDRLECDGIIIDEASMVGKEIMGDLQYFGLPLIFVGDHGQLPPVSATEFNLMQKPHFSLETVHRNAGEIAYFAEHIRKGNEPQSFVTEGKVSFINQITDDMLLQVDQVICAYNVTRLQINERIRAALGYTEFLYRGERLMFLRNSKKVGVFNGMQGIVLNWYFDHGGFFIDFESNGQRYNHVEIDCTTLTQEKPEFKFDPETPHPVAYAYCSTCHKAQGDQWGKVCVIEQTCKHWDMKRWSYTAASRAENHLNWVLATTKSKSVNKTIPLKTQDPTIQKIFGI